MVKSRLRAVASVTLVLSLFTAAPGYASLEEIVANADDGQRNLLRLVLLLRDLQQSGALDGELADVVSSLDAADPRAAAALLTLRTLLPAVNRLQHLRERASAGLRNSSLGLHDNRPGADWGRLRRSENADGSERDRVQVWLEHHRDDAEQDDRDGFDGFDAETDSVALGAEFELTPDLSLGLNLGRYDADVESTLFGSDRQDGHDAGMNLSYRFGDHSLSAALGITRTDTERTRAVIVATALGLRAIRLDADIDAEQRALSIGYSGLLAGGDSWQLSTIASATYAILDTDDYVERGPGELSLQVSSAQEKQLLGSLGASLSWTFIRGGWLLAPQVNAAVEHDFRADPTITTARFRNTAPRFRTEGFAVEETRFRFGSGIYFMHATGFGLGLHYEGQRKGDYRYDAAIISLQMSF